MEMLFGMDYQTDIESLNCEIRRNILDDHEDTARTFNLCV